MDVFVRRQIRTIAVPAAPDERACAGTSTVNATYISDYEAGRQSDESSFVRRRIRRALLSVKQELLLYLLELRWAEQISHRNAFFL